MYIVKSVGRRPELADLLHLQFQLQHIAAGPGAQSADIALLLRMLLGRAGVTAVKPMIIAGRICHIGLPAGIGHFGLKLPFAAQCAGFRLIEL